MTVKNEENLAGRKNSSGLFIQEDSENGVYDLDEFKERFLEYKDSTGYLVAKEMLTQVPPKERWTEWKRIFKSNTRMRRVHEDWIEELDISTRADAERKIASGCDSKDFARLKFIREGGLYSKGKVGRPSKEQATREEKIKKGVADRLTEGNLTQVISLGRK